MEKWVSPRVTWRSLSPRGSFQYKSLKLTELADITHAWGRRLERKLNDAATFTFTVDRPLLGCGPTEAVRDGMIVVPFGAPMTAPALKRSCTAAS